MNFTATQAVFLLAAAAIAASLAGWISLQGEWFREQAVLLLLYFGFIAEEDEVAFAPVADVFARMRTEDEAEDAYLDFLAEQFKTMEAGERP